LQEKKITFEILKSKGNKESKSQMERELKLMLIDDDEDDRELFLIALEGMDTSCDCVTVASCREALVMLNKGEFLPDFIFLDLNMPQLNGRECLCEMKKSPTLSLIPVIIFSTSSERHDIEDTRAGGAIGFITKPSKTSELSTILDLFFKEQLQKK
jgi:CheY-like chemotaxis protein